ncbi:hypothetical protein VF04_04485 [Nostoc linckia z7]|uniref:Uncharacterized protein n=2 Tax=Nostoc linckia TaxID=92942 RepID=A0A9Q6EN24_NOSLI|nr:hypothetical protein [Nostoc linckia]PHK42966.1 hypothetical protein VF12_01185 [Nostoc linckia z15]PHK48123.1 hypothetical protein VF13_02160 [Nostoc linckia z16]PHJ65043.1 hypothetical protein VF02_11970 [Nostoc linckia z1]PHJ70084.1 hypothetical protein VF05_11365 [Nostoc linckia z3]PHJ75122.1 hypothetical protein VF03_12290 [Nostoc linckia z2]
MQRSASTTLAGKAYSCSLTPNSSPNPGDYWDEPDANGRISQWEWSGNSWISREKFRTTVDLYTGQTISLLGTIIGLLNNNSSDVSFSTGNTNHLYLTKLNIGFSTTGNLSSSNYWRLNFKSSGSVVQMLNVQSGNNGETTGDIRKSGAEINQIYAHNGRYQLNLIQIGTPPNISNPVAMVEYRLAKP